MRVLRFAFPSFPPKTVILLAFILLFTASAYAQTNSNITGDVKDSNGAALAGVSVTATQVDTGLTRVTTSEAEGRFVFPSLPVGLYELRAEFSGFEPLVFPGVVLTVN